VGIPAEHVFTSSTGVIGEPLNASKITDVLPGWSRAEHADGFETAARAIMTTDTFPKGACRTGRDRRHDRDHRGHRQGVGHDRAGHGDDAGLCLHRRAVTQDGLQAMLTAATKTSFNAITVDSDTSTSDTVLLAATGRRMRPHRSGRSAEGKVFGGADAGDADLALQIVRDGEGATKLVEVRVTGRQNRARCRQGRAVHRQLAARSRPRSPAKTRTGAGSSWRSANPARRRTATC
jgi:glutamate N-acetyltransferase/amino-acid N-acetyltransferase